MSKKVFAILSLSLLALTACKTTADITEDAVLDEETPVVEEDVSYEGIDAVGDVTDAEESADLDVTAEAVTDEDAAASVEAQAEAEVVQ